MAMRAWSGALAVLAAALVVAGCAAVGDPAGDADPARVAPAGSLIYYAFDLAPEGAQAVGAERAARRVGGLTNPADELRDEIADPIAAWLAAPGVDFGQREDDAFARYVRPWLGGRAGVAITDLDRGGDEEERVEILAVRDRAAAQRALDALAADATASVARRTHGGVAYLRFPPAGETEAIGLVDDHVVIGGETALRASIDALQGGGLATRPDYAAAATRAGAEGRLAFFYLAPGAFPDVLVTELGGLLRSQLRLPSVVGDPGRLVGTLARAAQAPGTPAAPSPSLAAGLSAAGDRLTLDGVTESAGETPPQLRRPSRIVPDLPGDSWLVTGGPDVGETIRAGFEQASTPEEKAALEELRRQVQADTGLDLERDIAPAIGDYGLFVRGITERTYGVGLVAEAPDPAATRRVLARLGTALLSESPTDEVRVARVTIAGAEGFRITDPRDREAKPVYAVLRAKRVVVAYGENTTRAALSRKTPIGQTGYYAAARASLGGRQPDLFVAFERLRRLVSSEDLEEAEELKALRTLAVASETAEGVQRVRAVLRFR